MQCLIIVKRKLQLEKIENMAALIKGFKFIGGKRVRNVGNLGEGVLVFVIRVL